MGMVYSEGYVKGQYVVTLITEDGHTSNRYFPDSIAALDWMEANRIQQYNPGIYNWHLSRRY